MDLKKHLFAAVGILLALASSAQVKITGFSPGGRLTWTNLAAANVSATPFYRVDRSSSLRTGSWETVNYTSQTSITNIQPIHPGGAFYRVTWINGQVWTYAGYSGQTLAATGKLYFGVSHLNGCVIDGGAYDLAPWSAYRFGFGQLFPIYDADLDCSHLIGFTPEANHDYFEIDVVNAGSDTWSGNWRWDGLIASVYGTFVARRIINSQ